MADPWDQSRARWSRVEPEAGPDLEDPDELGGHSGPERYTLGNVLGRGGMGRVRVAVDRVLRREVALKELVQPAPADRAASRRLAREAWITARLDHPGIIGVHDAGRMPDGGPFYTMRLVRGRTLGAALAEAPDMAGRLGLLRHVLAACEAVAFAHQAGVVHRDIKPDNILIGSFGETQVGDWGLAAPTPAREADWADLPPGPPDRVVGSPGWMSPEQAAGEPPDPRADVWGLGGVLFALVSGEPPRGLAPETPRAARRLLDVAPAAPPELAAIVDRALAPPAERYPDAGALAADLARFFEGRRVLAYTYTSLDLLRRLVAAWRAPLLVGAVGLVALAAAVVVGWARTQRERDRALDAEHLASAALAESQHRLALSLVQQAEDAVDEDARPRAELLAAASLEAEDSPQARGVLAAFAHTPRPTLQGQEPAPECRWYALSEEGLLCGQEDRISRWDLSPLRERWSAALSGVTGALPLAAGEPVQVLSGAFTSLLLDPQTGDRLAELTETRAHPWDPITGPHATLVQGQPLDPALRARPRPCALSLRLFTARGPHLAALCQEGRILVGDRTRLEPLPLLSPLQGEHEVSAATFSADGARLLAGSIRGGLWLLDARSGAVLAERMTTLGTLSRIALAPDDAHVAVSGTYGGVGVWDLRTGAWLGELPAGRPRGVTFLDPATLLIVESGRFTRWSIPAVGRPYRYELAAGLNDVAFSPDGRRALVGGGDGRVTLLDLEGGTQREIARVGEQVVKGLSWSPDGQRAVATAMGGARLVELDLSGGPPRTFLDAQHMRRVGVLADGTTLATSFDYKLARFDAEGRLVERNADYQFYELEVEAGGQRALALSTTGAVLEIRSGQPGVRLLRRAPEAVAVDAAGELVAVAMFDAVLLFGADGAEREIAVDGAGLQDLSLSADGRRVAACGLDGRARVWDTATGALLGELPGHRERVVALELSADGQTLVTVSWDRTARVWDLGPLSSRGPGTLEVLRAAWGEGG